MSDYSKISNYELKGDIGEGNFGKVKLGIFRQTGEEFAVKILNKEMIKEKMKNTVFKENEIITKFNHVNVVFVFNIIEDEKNYYIVMEYCKSGELFDYIVNHEHLEEDEAAYFFYQLINGVEYIHSLGVAHRDLKPENLLLTDDKILKIIDFGLSHEFNGKEYLKTKCGSPSYAAPEIIKGLPYDGFKTDIWCCGIILYAMVCGYLPFEGENNKILFKNIVECNPEIPENLSEETQDLISSILISEPDERITINEIKRHNFYLRGKELCKIDYPRLQRELNKKRQNMSNNNFDDSKYKKEKEKNKKLDDNECINQEITISFDHNDDILINEELVLNENKNNNNKKSKEIIDSLSNKENNQIQIKEINENNTSKINNNSKSDSKIINKKNSDKEEKKNTEYKRNFQFMKKKPILNAFRDKIFALNKNFNKQRENFTNNLHFLLNTDINAIVTNKINKNPLYNNKLINNSKNNVNINLNEIENNTNNINTISSTIKNNYTNNIINPNDINNITNEKKSTLIDTLQTNSKTKINHKLKIPERDKNKINTPKLKGNNFFILKNMQFQNNRHNKKIGGNKFNIELNGFSPKNKKNTINNNINKAACQKNNINIITNISNTINNFGTLNFLSTINNNNNILNNNKSNKRNKILSEKNNKNKIENNANINTYNAMKDLINNKQNSNYSCKIPKIDKNNHYLNNLPKNVQSTNSSNSYSAKKNKSNILNNSKSFKNKKNKNSSNIVGNIKNKGFEINNNKSKNISHNNIISNIDNKKYKKYPSLNIGNKLILESEAFSTNSNAILSNNNKNISISGKNKKRNNTFYKTNINITKSENRKSKKNELEINLKDKNNTNINNTNINSCKKNRKECINYFNYLSTLFLKTENNVHKDKFKNSNVSSVNSRKSKKSKNSRGTSKKSKNSKSSKSSKNSKKKYNLIRYALKYKIGNFNFNKKGGSEGKTNGFIQHSKLLNMNTFRKNNFQNINGIIDNCIGFNNMNNDKYNDKKSNKSNDINNIKVIRQNKVNGKKVIYNQINIQTLSDLNSIYNLNQKKKKNLPYIKKKDL